MFYFIKPMYGRMVFKIIIDKALWYKDNLHDNNVIFLKFYLIFQIYILSLAQMIHLKRKTKTQVR